MTEEEWRSFDRCWPFLQRAAERSYFGYSRDYVKTEIDESRAVLWPLRTSAIVVTLDSCPKGKICRVWLAGGDLSELVEFAPFLRWWAKEKEGCIAVMSEGRAGWGRVFRQSRKLTETWIEEL